MSSLFFVFSRDFTETVRGFDNAEYLYRLLLFKLLQPKNVWYRLKQKDFRQIGGETGY